MIKEPAEQAELKQSIIAYFSNNPLVAEASKTLNNSARIGIKVDTQQFVFQKNGGKPAIQIEPTTAEVDVQFTVAPAAMHSLVSKERQTVGQVGIFVMECMVSADPNLKVSATVRAGFLALMAKGYWGVLASGGVDVAKYLAQKGLSNPAKIKEAISKMRG